MRTYHLELKARSVDNPSGEYRDSKDYGIRLQILNKKEYEFKTCYQAAVSNQSQEVFSGILELEVVMEAENGKEQFFMPGFMYNRNRGNVQNYMDQVEKKGDYPSICEDGKQLSALDWMVRGDRLTHPVSMIYTGKEVIGIAAYPTIIRTEEGMVAGVASSIEEVIQFCGYTCHAGQGRTGVGYTLGYENSPYLFVCSTEPVQSTDLEKAHVSLMPGASISFEFEVYCLTCTEVTGIHKVIQDVYDKYHQNPRKKGVKVKEAVEILSGALYKYAYSEELHNYSNLVFYKDDVLNQNQMMSIGWTGGTVIAAPELLAACKLGDKAMHDQAICSIQYIVDHCMNRESGLPYDACDHGKWTYLGWWHDFLSQAGHSSYVIGQFLFYLLKAYTYEEKYYFQKHNDWIKAAKSIFNIIMKTINEEGEFPYLWSAKDGSALEYDSFCGCWCTAAVVLYIQITGDDRWLESCEKSYSHYYHTYVEKLECYGTPHDTWKATDSEGILSFIRAGKVLHQITKKEEYLYMMKAGILYEFTFKFCWNTPIEKEPLHKLGWTSCGGSVTSVCNPHVHPMSSIVVDDLIYFYEQTKDEYVWERIKDTVLWGLQTFATVDGEYGYGKAGWMSERYCYSEGLLSAKNEDGTLSSTWPAYLPWGAANVLESLAGEIYTQPPFREKANRKKGMERLSISTL